MKKGMHPQQINVNYRAMPVFSDRSITVSHVASLPSKKDRKKAARKEGMIRVIFVDSISNSTVSDVVMTPIAAEQLIKGISNSLEKMKKDVSDPKISAPPAPAPQPQQTYIG